MNRDNDQRIHRWGGIELISYENACRIAGFCGSVNSRLQSGYYRVFQRIIPRMTGADFTQKMFSETRYNSSIQKDGVFIPLDDIKKFFKSCDKDYVRDEEIRLGIFLKGTDAQVEKLGYFE